MSVYAPTQKPVPVRSSSAVEGQNLHAPTVHRHRKTVSTGGGRAWSDAEEAYLIETREHKMPYKHIASQLKKTELACRLHYHQLSFGSKARRNPSISSGYPGDRSSAPPAAKLRSETPTPQKHLPSFSPPDSPPQHTEYSPIDSSKTPQSHKSILPKPISSVHRRSQEAEPLRLVTQDVGRYHERQYVDMARLDHIYEEHRLHFWSTIARSYGCNLSPATLEEAWCRAHGMAGSRFPPTPRGSPQSSAVPSSVLSGGPHSAVTEPGKTFTPINARERASPRASTIRGNSFSVSSLLTEDRDVRSPARERKVEDVDMS